MILIVLLLIRPTDFLKADNSYSIKPGSCTYKNGRSPCFHLFRQSVIMCRLQFCIFFGTACICFALVPEKYL